MHAAELIERKRNGEELSAAEVREFIAGYVRGDVPDYQAAAFLMAVWFRGLTAAETFALTDAMVASGETIDLAARLGRRVVDKHSTGGVGDKITIAVGPVVAACGVPFGKMSGRGLGHTGGTLDKLESIPGFRVELTTDELVEQVREIGIAVAGQTADLVPADKKLYALRDVTATIDQVSLIAASIMSKKIAAGASAVVLDVKVGEGAFMRTVADARELAREMLALGDQAGMDVVCVLTDMDQPLGRAVGNALEVREAWETVSGGGPGTSASWLSTRPRSFSRSRISEWTRKREGSARRERSRTARRWRPTTGGFERREATPTRVGCPQRRSCGSFLHRRPATSAASGRGRWPSRRWSSARAAKSPENRLIMRSASSASANAGRRSPPASRWPRSMPVTMPRPRRPRSALLPHTRSATSRSRSRSCST